MHRRLEAPKQLKKRISYLPEQPPSASATPRWSICASLVRSRARGGKNKVIVPGDPAAGLDTIRSVESRDRIREPGRSHAEYRHCPLGPGVLLPGAGMSCLPVMDGTPFCLVNRFVMVDFVGPIRVFVFADYEEDAA